MEKSGGKFLVVFLFLEKISFCSFVEGDNLVATGVLIEGYSVEDIGTGICFNVFFIMCSHILK